MGDIGRQWCWVSAEVVLPALLTPWADSGLMGLRASYLSSAAGFEGCSMVPSIYPLETLHNSLSLKQVSEFLAGVCESAGDPHTRTNRGKKHTLTLVFIDIITTLNVTSDPSFSL